MKNQTTYRIVRLFVTAFIFNLISLQVNAQDCTANFTYSIDENRPNIVHFNDSSIGAITSWEWDFNDNPNGGSYSSLQNPTHTFPENGMYEIKLFISSDSCSDETIKTIQIEVPLTINFSFKLDSINPIPNTFIFESEIDGYYDNLIWNFDNETILNKNDTTHVYAEQDKDYQVCLTAQYVFNDTSVMRKVFCKGLTTSEYFDMGGQVFFGDSLLNNPSPTGDTAIAYLYRVDGHDVVAIDTNYFNHLGYYWFAQKLKAHYIVKTALTPNSKHYYTFAPTYVGNTTLWDDAQIINLSTNKYREDISLVENYSTKIGATHIDGSIFDILNIPTIESSAIVCLFNMDDQLVNYQYIDKKGNYSFKNISSGHYMLSADLTGIPVKSQLIYVGDDNRYEYKAINISFSAELFPNPANNYSILSFENKDEFKELNIQILSMQGQVLSNRIFGAKKGVNYISLDLTAFKNGLLFVKVTDGNKQKVLKLFHY